MTDQPNDRWANGVRAYIESTERWLALTDRIIDLVGRGDLDGILQAVGDHLNGCDAVDDDGVARWEAARRAVAVRAAERDELEAERDALRSLLNLDLLTRASTACRNAQRQMVGQVRWFDWVPAHLDRIAAALRVPQEENHGK